MQPHGSRGWCLSLHADDYPKNSPKQRILKPQHPFSRELETKAKHSTTHIKMCRQRDKQTFSFRLSFIFLWHTHTDNEKRKWKSLRVSGRSRPLGFRPRNMSMAQQNHLYIGRSRQSLVMGPKKNHGWTIKNYNKQQQPQSSTRPDRKIQIKMAEKTRGIYIARK